MMEERKAKGGQLYELDSLMGRFAKGEQAVHIGIDHGLKELGQKFRRIFNNVTEGVLLTDPENNLFAFGNEAVCQMLGHEMDDITILEMTSICPPEDSYHLMGQFISQADGDLVLRQNIPFKRKEGDLFHADIISIPLTVTDKKYVIIFIHKTCVQKIKTGFQDNAYPDSQPGQTLTETEIKILKLIVEGKSNKEIAKTFHRSKRTIENHRAHLMKKLHVDNPIELYKRAIRAGLVDFPGEQRRINDI